MGTLKHLQITSRDGAGAWGGRVKTIKIIGSSRTATVSGTTFQRVFGMGSSLYTVVGEPFIGCPVKSLHLLTKHVTFLRTSPRNGPAKATIRAPPVTLCGKTQR